jgi:sulfonate transport system permease protein
VLPTFVALAQVPTLAWIPLFMLFFGIGECSSWWCWSRRWWYRSPCTPWSACATPSPSCAKPPPCCACPHLLFLRLLLPAALPAFLAGVRLALATGWTSLLAVELLASSEGIGYLMVWGRQLFMLDLVFLCILVIGLVGALMDRGFSRLERACCTGRNRPPASSRGQAPRAGRACCCRSAAGLWQAANSFGWVDANILASPLEALRSLSAGLLDGSLSEALRLSLQRTLAGLLLGGGAGFALGLLLGLSQRRAPARPEPVGAAPGGAVRLGAAAHRLVRPGRRRQAGVRRPGRVLPAADRHPARHRQPVAAAGRGGPGAAPGPGNACACWCCRAPRRRSSPACAWR